MSSVTREALPPAGAGVAPTARWKARPAAGAAAPREASVIPRFPHHKATRCCHCDFCRPHGGTGDVRLCTAPGHAGNLVIGDQWACGQYQQVVQ